MARKFLGGDSISCKFSPSLLCMDFLHVQEQLDILACHADFLHADLMDTQFVEALGLFPAFIATVASATKLPIDCHLMMKNPEHFIEPLAAAGARLITPHAEAITTGAFRILEKIRNAGCGVGVAVNPATPLSAVEPYLHLLDKLTIMTIEPGFPGARFLPEMYPKIREAKRLRTEKKLHFLIEIDGSCSDENFKELFDCGTDVFVTGTAALFSRSSNLEVAWNRMLQSFASTLNEAEDMR